jgi:hypothetical protein
MKRMMCGVLVLLALIAVAGMLTSAWAQEVTAAIVGTVTDPSGAPIKGASVTATDTERGTVWTAQTNDAGAYNLLRLPIGNYAVKVSAAGFETSVHPAFAVVLNQTARVDVQMKLGKATETVEVTAAPPLLQTDSTDISTHIDSVVTENVPLLTRNYGQLTLLTAGAVSTNPGAFTSGQNTFQVGRPYINGNREQTSNYILDGIDNNQHDNNEVAYSPNPDAIQEFNLITQNPSAEFGNFLGGIVNATIKSGTNSYHGSAFEFWRNDKLNANSWSNGLTTPVTPKEAFHWNQFGATFGGPIIKNRVFFFVDYEGLRNPTNSTQNAVVMSPNERAGNFGELCTDAGGAFNSSGICSVASAQLYAPAASTAPAARVAVPNNNLTAAGLTLSTAATNIVTSSLYPTAPGNVLFYKQTELNSADQGDVKVDFTPNDKDHIYGRYTQQSVRNPTAETFLLSSNGFPNNQYPLHNGVGDWTHAFNPTLLNDFRIGFSYFPVTQSYSNPVSENLPSTFGIPGSPVSFMPSIQGTLSGVADLGNALSAANVFADTVFQASDTLLKTVGNHDFHVGFQFNRYYDNFLYPGNEGLAGFFNFNGQYTSNGTTGGSGLADFMLGLPNNYGIGAGTGNRHMRNNVFAAYALDNWRVSSTVTLNLGLRWELFTPRYASDGNAVNYDLDTGALIFPNSNNEGTGSALYKQYNGITNFEPRIGIAWQPGFARNTVVHAAWGVSNFFESNGVNNLLTQNPPFEVAHNVTYFPTGTTANLPTTTLDQGFTGFPTGCTLQLAQALSPTCFSGTTIHAFNVNLRPTVHYQWNLSVQHQFGNSTTVQVGYVGQNNEHLSNITNLPQGMLTSNGTVLPSPFLGGVANAGSLASLVGQGRYTTSNAVGNYNALQLILQERLARGLQAQVNYTWSKCMSDSPGFYGQYGDNVATESQTIAGWAFPQNQYNQIGDYGRCAQNVTSNFNGYVVYQLPFGRGKQFGNGMNAIEDGVVGGWRLSSGFVFHTGFAQTIFANADYSGTGSFSERADCVPGVSSRVPMTFDPSSLGVHFLNPAAVTNPTSGFGNCPVGSFDGPGYYSADLGLGKDFRLWENHQLEFRMDATNIANHPIFDFGQEYSGQHTAGASNYGEVFTSQGSRQIQLALRYHF